VPDLRTKLETLNGIDERLQRVETAVAVLHNALQDTTPVAEWLTTGEVASEVGRAEYTVRGWCHAGRLRAEKTGNGRQWRVHREEIRRYQREGLFPE